MIFISKIKQLLYGERKGGQTLGLGLLPDEKDERDLTVGILGWGKKYEPKSQRLILPTLSTKDQTSRNTCTFESVIVQKEPDEGYELSVQSIVIWAKKMGLLKGNGFSSLRNSQKVLQEFGATKVSMLPGKQASWEEYSREGLLTPKLKELAAEHKTHSYWSLNSLSEIYEALDNGRIVQVALMWYDGYNMRGGLKAPFVLLHRKGTRVGAHAVDIIGYDRDYYGLDVFVFQNSYGKSWGDNGKFYMRVSDFAQEFATYSAWINLDITPDTGKFLRDYTGKAVKAFQQPEIYYIEDGKKRHIKDMDVFKKYFTKYETVRADLLEEVPDGSVLNA